MSTFADQVLLFNNSFLKEKLQLPKGVGVLNPFTEETVQNYTQKFYHKFYNDTQNRFFVFGINPGRFGGGITGIPFTDPVHLEENCGIANDLQKKKELSSQFVYEFIEAFGGAKAFYAKFFITAVCPLGFMKDGKNYNYYDDKSLEKALDSFIVKTMQQQLAIGANREVCLCLGEGKNYKYLHKLNKQHGFFNEIIPLAHPRYILQYKRKEKDRYLKEYVEASKSIIL